jgi:hypothetical protein
MFYDPEGFSPKSKFFFNPDDVIIFNASRLLLLFETAKKLNIKKGIDLEKLAYYDFLAANPFLLIDEKHPSRLELEMEGFKPNKLEYVGAEQRFRTKRLSLKQYLALLLSKGLIKLENEDGKIVFYITAMGIEIAGKFSSMYAIAYRKSADCVISILKKYSDTKLTEEADKWFSKPFQIDLIDLVDAHE